MIHYFDSSALIKRYVIEDGSNDVSDLIEQSGMVGSSLLTQVEMAAALTKSVRLKILENQEAENAWQDFLEHWPSFTRLAVTPVLAERAARLTWKLSLRGYDAAHLAAVLIWQETIETQVTLATYDRELWTAGKEAGLAVWPERLG